MKTPKPSFIERFFFWFGLLLVGLSGYLYTTAYLKSETHFNAQHEIDQTKTVTFIPFYNPPIAEHEFTNKDVTKLFGVGQYPKDYSLGYLS